MQDINLQDYLGVVAKRKKLFFAVGFLALFLMSGILLKGSVSAPKLYKITMYFDLGSLGVTDAGDNIYLDSKEKIKSKIYNTVFHWRVMDENKKAELFACGAALNFDVVLPDDVNLIGVSTIQSKNQVKSGEKLLNQLFDSLSKDFDKKILIEKKDFNNQILQIKRNIDGRKSSIALLEKKREIFEDREKRLFESLNVANENLIKLIQLRDELLNYPKKQINLDSVLFYLNVIQQNFDYANNLNSQLVEIKTEKEETLSEIRDLERVVNETEQEIKQKKAYEDEIRNIEIVQAPKVARCCPKTNIFRNFIGAIFLSMIIGIFAVFLAEFWKNMDKNDGK